ncbi:hypothetical protein [Hymenobacter sp.]|uniref:hypothetical protein n=1 Tax=Hymenobacter sp. TaxID=1898978 RepID=UPI00286B7AC8|nr:hypothetical protein [Hymenobacter sp.]
MLLTKKMLLFVLTVLGSTSLSAQAQVVYYRRPAPRPVVIVHPAPRLLVRRAPVVVVAPVRPVYYAPAPAYVVARPRTVAYRRFY